MSIGSRLTLKQRIVTAALGAAMLGGAAAAANAADLGPVPGWRARHVSIARSYWNWRDRCAYAGYYCLYAEYGYVYSYPFDDRASAYSLPRRRHR